MAGGVDEVGAGAHDGDGACPGLQRAFMRRSVYALGQARHHHPAGLAQPLGEAACVVSALRAGVAAPDDGHRRRLQAGQVTLHIEQQRRVGRLQQQRREGGVAHRQHMAVGVILQPLQRGRQALIEAGGCLLQGGGAHRARQLTQGGVARGQHRGR